MGMSAIGLMKLFCLLSVCCILVESASVLENSGDFLQSWLLRENEEPSSQQSLPPTRRITPKSVFIAPTFNCESGEKLDSTGNCVKMIRVDENAQRNYWLNKIIKFGQGMGFNNPQRQGNGDDRIISNNQKNHSSNEEKENFGPLQLSIPFNSKNLSNQIFESTSEKIKEISTLENTIIRVTSPTTTEMSETSYQEYTEKTTLPDFSDTPFTVTDYTETEINTELFKTDETPTESAIEISDTENPSNTSQNCLDCYTTEINLVTTVKSNYNSVMSLNKPGFLNYNIQPPTENSLIDIIAPLMSGNKKESYVNRPVNKNSSLSDLNNAESIEKRGTVISPFQKLPNVDRRKPLCDPAKNDCKIVFNILPSDTPHYPLNRKPSAAFVRFPETPTKSTFIRFPLQKIKIDNDDSTYAETGLRYWERRYPPTTWNSWKSRPQFVHIMPEYGTDVNYIRSPPYFQT